MVDKTEETILNEGEDKNKEQSTPVSNDPAPKEQDEPKKSPDNPYDPLLKEITTNDGRAKYSSVEDALKSIPHAQSHIETLESEAEEKEAKIAELQAELQKKSGAEDLAQMIRSKPRDSNKPVEDSGLTREEVQNLVRNAIKTEEANKIRNTNLNQAKEGLVKHFGSTEDADKAYRKLAQEKGLAVGILNEIAAQNPKELLNMFGIEGPKKPAKQIDSSFNPSVVKAQEEGKPKKPVSVMGGADTKELIQAWRNAAPSEE